MTRAPRTASGVVRASRSRAGDAVRHAARTRLRLLLVQDGPQDGQIMRAVLTALGSGRAPEIDVHRAPRLAEAIDRLSHRGLDAVALDLGLPDAFDALRRLRAADPSVALVGVVEEDDSTIRHRAFLEGAEEVVVSPCSVPDLCRAFRHAVERHRIRAALRIRADQDGAIVEGSIQGIVIHQDCVIRYANPA